MLSVEEKINGCTIGYMEISNQLFIENELYIYHVEYHRMNREPKIMEFTVKHRREDGVEKLLLLAYQGINKRLKRENNLK